MFELIAEMLSYSFMRRALIAGLLVALCSALLSAVSYTHLLLLRGTCYLLCLQHPGGCERSRGERRVPYDFCRRGSDKKPVSYTHLYAKESFAGRR